MLKRIIGFLLVVGLVCLALVKAFAGLPEADALYVAGKYAEARTEYVDVLGKATTDIDKFHAQLLIGATYEMERNWAQAVVEYLKTLEMKNGTGNDISSAGNSLGLCYEQQNDYSNARMAYGNVLIMVKANPFHKSASQFGIAVCYEKEGKTTEAQEEYKKVLLVKGAGILHLSLALSKINFTSIDNEGNTIKVSRNEKDIILMDAYDTFIGSSEATTKEGLNYLSNLVRMMSAAAQAILLK